MAKVRLVEGHSRSGTGTGTGTGHAQSQTQIRPQTQSKKTTTTSKAEKAARGQSKLKLVEERLSLWAPGDAPFHRWLSSLKLAAAQQLGEAEAKVGAQAPAGASSGSDLGSANVNVGAGREAGGVANASGSANTKIMVASRCESARLPCAKARCVCDAGVRAPGAPWRDHCRWPARAWEAPEGLRAA